jgi:hypothetical protein
MASGLTQAWKGMAHLRHTSLTDFNQERILEEQHAGAYVVVYGLQNSALLFERDARAYFLSTNAELVELDEIEKITKTEVDASKFDQGIALGDIHRYTNDDG